MKESTPLELKKIGGEKSRFYHHLLEFLTLITLFRLKNIGLNLLKNLASLKLLKI
jgi:hypothetical protein